jgi:hypothetical protein
MQAQSKSTSAGGGKANVVTCHGDMATDLREAEDSEISGLEAKGRFLWVGSQATAVSLARPFSNWPKSASWSAFDKCSLPAS